MGVRGAWNFLALHDLRGQRLNTVQDALSNSEQKIHVDVAGSFYDAFEDNFLKCPQYAFQKRDLATRRVLERVSAVLKKHKCILYIDGQHTAERARSYAKRIDTKLKTQKLLEFDLSKYIVEKSKARQEHLVDLARKLFRITSDMRELFVDAAIKDGWDVVNAEGEAEVAIGRVGGIVLSNDSDMLFYPKITGVIKPSGKSFYYHKKEDILRSLSITSEAFTALGILADNDYDPDHYAEEKTAMNGEIDKSYFTKAFEERYNIVLENSLILDDLKGSTTSDLIRAHVQCYLTSMNDKTTKDVDLAAYRNSHRIFSLQQEQIVPKENEKGELLFRPQDYIAVIFGV